jgi:signal transduction histidine kinase
MSATSEARAARYRLAAVNLVVLALVLAVTLGAAAFSALGSSHALVDQELREAAARVMARIEHERHDEAERHDEPDHPRRSHDDDDDDEHQPRRAPADPLASLELDDETGVIVIVATTVDGARRPDGRALPVGLPDEGGLAAAFRGEEALGDATVGAASMRLLSVPVRRDGHVVGVVQLAKPTAEARASLTRTLAILAVTGLAGLLLSAVGSLFLAARAMRPIELAMERQQRFIADASHELRTPVAVLRARAELLSKDAAALPADVRSELTQLHRDADELSELLGELLDLARLEAGATELELGPVPIGDVAEELAEQLRPLAEERAVTLTARAEPVFATASSTRVRQVLRALVDNALAHTRAGGHVTIEADVHEGRARLAVRDDGEGIAPEHLPKVRERFYRADVSRTRAPGARRGGAGLGLAIANELVRRMHGELRVESTLGKGTTMTVLLPSATGAPRAP